MEKAMGKREGNPPPKSKKERAKPKQTLLILIKTFIPEESSKPPRLKAHATYYGSK
jgi:hypothetical protein